MSILVILITLLMLLAVRQKFDGTKTNVTVTTVSMELGHAISG